MKVESLMQRFGLEIDEAVWWVRSGREPQEIPEETPEVPEAIGTSEN